MSVICLNCDGWGCSQCKNEREAAKGGEQGPYALVVELAGLRAEIERLKDFEANSLSARAWTEILKELLAMTAERDRLLAELALLRVPGGAA